MILEVNKFERESALHGSQVPFALLPLVHRSIKLLKQKIKQKSLLTPLPGVRLAGSQAEKLISLSVG